jgi:hypothetical protein
MPRARAPRRQIRDRIVDLVIGRRVMRCVAAIRPAEPDRKVEFLTFHALCA